MRLLKCVRVHHSADRHRLLIDCSLHLPGNTETTLQGTLHWYTSAVPVWKSKGCPACAQSMSKSGEDMQLSRLSTMLSCGLAKTVTIRILPCAMHTQDFDVLCCSYWLIKSVMGWVSARGRESGWVSRRGGGCVSEVVGGWAGGKARRLSVTVL